MKMSKFLLMPLAFAIMTNSAIAGDLSKAQIISKTGDWRVTKVIDSMTDKASCTGLYKNNFDIQLSENKLYIDMRSKGSVDGFSFRIDDDQPITQLPTEIEKNIGIVRIGGETNEDKAAFSRLLQGNRLRVRVLTLLGSDENYDISLNGFNESYAVITSTECGSTQQQKNQTSTDNNTMLIPKDISGLIKKADFLNDKCRGGSGDNPETIKSCDERDKYVDLLHNKGWCYGKASQIEADKTWQKCE